jgi:hypothetical protein
MIHVSSFVLSLDSSSSDSIFFESSFDAFRSRKRARASLPSSSRKRVKSFEDQCECILPSK